MLTSLWLYSNALLSIPETMQKMPSLRQIWIEGNDALNGDAADAFVSADVGTQDARDVRRRSTTERQDARARPIHHRRGNSRRCARGVFQARAMERIEDEDARVDAPVLVASFGSAPGVPQLGWFIEKIA